MCISSPQVSGISVEKYKVHSLVVQSIALNTLADSTPSLLPTQDLQSVDLLILRK